jgi:hypothetical protein
MCLCRPNRKRRGSEREQSRERQASREILDLALSGNLDGTLIAPCIPQTAISFGPQARNPPLTASAGQE